MSDLTLESLFEDLQKQFLEVVNRRKAHKDIMKDLSVNFNKERESLDAKYRVEHEKLDLIDDVLASKVIAVKQRLIMLQNTVLDKKMKAVGITIES